MYQQSNEQVAPSGFALTEARAFRALVMAQTFDFVTDFFRRAVKHCRQKAAVAELRSLNNQALKDIGIHRSGILSVVHGDETNREARRHDYD